MKVMVIVKATKDSEAGVMPSERLLTDMGNFNEELVKAGIMLAGEGLKPSSAGARVHFSGKQRIVSDGPFAETKELVAGYWIWKVKSLDEAIEWVRRCPNPHEEDGDIEIRPLFEADDFGEVFTPELREQEASLRAQTLGLAEPRFEDAPARVVAGLNESYTSETRSKIPAQWDRFAPQIGKVLGQVAQAAYGVCWNNTPECGFDYLTGVEVKNAGSLPGNFKSVTLPVGRYAVFAHGDHISSLPKTLETIWKQWAPDSGLKLAETPWFERYTEKFDPRQGRGGIEIWLPLSA